MSDIEKGYVPLREAQSEKVQIALTLPSFVDEEKVGASLKKIQRLCQLGGIGQLQVIGLTDQETSSDVPTVVGFNSQGGVYAGKISSKVSVPTFQSQSDKEHGSFLEKDHSRMWLSTRIAINMDEVTKRIQEDNKWASGIRTPEAWAHYLNKSIKDGIKQEGTFHLVLGLNKLNKFASASLCLLSLSFASGISLFPPSGSHPHIPDALSIGESYLGGCFIWNVFERILSRAPRLRDSNQRYSLFYGPELDRALALNVLAPRQALIKSF